MIRLFILALFPALCFGQTEALARADGELAANWQHTIDLLETKHSKGLVSRETVNKEKAQAEAVISRLRKNNAESPLREAFEKEYRTRLRMWRGEAPSWGERIAEIKPALKILTDMAWGQLLWFFVLIMAASGVGYMFLHRIADNLEEARRAAEEAAKPPPLSSAHGSASWAPHTTQLPNYSWPYGVFFGKSSTPQIARTTPMEMDLGAPVYSLPENHTLIVARTRTGKGTRIIIPTLANYFGSMLVIDPKGENAAVTARQRAKWEGTEVHILNPWGELGGTFQKLGFGPATYNPLDILDREDPNAVAIAQSLAGAICPTEGKGKDSFWSQASASLLTAVLLWLTDQPGEKKTLARARAIVSKTRTELKEKYLVKMAASEAFDGAIQENAAAFLDLASETYSGVLANLLQHTKFLSDPQIKASTSVSTFAMEDLVRNPVTLYLVIPPDRMDAQRTWLRLMIAAGMHTFKRAKVRGSHRCMFLIDEFPALGRLDDLPRDIATMAGYGVDFTLIVQGIDQLKDVYGDAHAAILSNCAYKWFCYVNDLHSAEYLSKTLGKATVQTSSKNVGEEKTSTTWSETGRELLTPDEILTMGRDTAILLQPGTKPVYLRPVDYWKLGEVFKRYRSQEPEMFWPLQFDPNPYHERSVRA